MSQSPTVQFSPFPADAKLRDMLDFISREVMLKLNCHALATVQSFNPDNQTIKASINYQATVFVPDANGNPVAQPITYAPIVDCPVYFPQGGGGSLTFPVASGDQCLIAFNDRDMDNFISTGNTGACATLRAHSFTDAIAFVGVNPFTKAISGFDTVRAILQKSGAKVGCSSSGVLIEANSIKLSTLLQNIITQLEDLCSAIESLTVSGVTTGAGTSGVPVNKAAFASISSSLSGISTQLSEVLE